VYRVSSRVLLSVQWCKYTQPLFHVPSRNCARSARIAGLVRRPSIRVRSATTVRHQVKRHCAPVGTCVRPGRSRMVYHRSNKNSIQPVPNRVAWSADAEQACRVNGMVPFVSRLASNGVTCDTIPNAPVTCVCQRSRDAGWIVLIFLCFE
jgi:hypothetical protein